MAEQAGEKRIHRVNWYRGFHRLTLLLWVLGSLSIAILFVGLGSLHKPFENVCTASDAKQYDQCLRPDASSSENEFEYFGKHGTTAGFQDQVRQEAVDPNRVLVRWTIPVYREYALGLAVCLVAWTTALWGAFYLLAWIARGFASGSERE